MKGNGWRDRDQQIGPWDAIEGAIAAKLESGYAEETCFGFAATVANETPPVDEEFRRTLRASIVAEANQDLEETRQIILKAIKSLPPDRRAVVVMRYFLGMSGADMSERMERPLSTIKWWLRDARKRLANLIDVSEVIG